MRFAKCLLPLALVAQTSCASRHCSVGEENCPAVDIPIETAEWLGGFTGLFREYYFYWAPGQAMMKDMMIGSDILHALTQRTRHKETMTPFDSSKIEGSLLRNFDTWGMQTTSFLKSLQERAALFQETAPRVMSALAGALEDFADDVDMFCDAFGTIMPNLAPDITTMTGELARAFAVTVDIFNEQ